MTFINEIWKTAKKYTQWQQGRRDGIEPGYMSRYVTTTSRKGIDLNM